jgi:hypothetical protein
MPIVDRLQRELGLLARELNVVLLVQRRQESVALSAVVVEVEGHESLG